MHLDQVHLGIKWQKVRHGIRRFSNRMYPENKRIDAFHFYCNTTGQPIRGIFKYPGKKIRGKGRWFVRVRWGTMANAGAGGFGVLRWLRLVCILPASWYKPTLPQRHGGEFLCVHGMIEAELFLGLVSSFLQCRPAPPGLVSTFRISAHEAKKAFFLFIPLLRLHIEVNLGRYLSKACRALVLSLLFAQTSSLIETWKHERFICSFELHVLLVDMKKIRPDIND